MKKLCLLLVILVMIALFSGCDSPKDGGKPVDDPKPISDAQIMQDGQGLYTLVRGKDASDTVINSVIELNKAIAKKTGVSLAVSTDRDEADEERCEILVGNTNRPESAAVLKTLPKNGYAVTIRNNKVVIIGTDDHALTLGLYEFYNRVLQSEEQSGTGYIVMRTDSIVTGTADALSLRDMVALGGTVKASCTQYFSIELPPESQPKVYHVAQGAASDGTYGYIAQRNTEETGTVISKYRMEDAELVATSEVLALGHANGMAYDPERKCLLVVDGVKSKNALWMVDPETLTITEKRSLPKAAIGIAVHPESGEYVIHSWDGFWILDKDFAVKSSHDRKPPAGYSNQSVWADESYIYFNMSGKTDQGKEDCILEVYDWAGHYVTRVTIPVAKEIEAMFMANDRYYASFNIWGYDPDEVYELFGFTFSGFKAR